MQLEAKDKLILNMLCDIYEHLKIEDRLDPDLIREAVSSDNMWALSWQYDGIFSGSDIETPTMVQEVADILEMWRMLEKSFEKLSLEDRQYLADEVGFFGQEVRFSGFCQNTEAKQCQILRMLVKKMGRWETFADRKFQSVPHSLVAYRRMLAQFRPIHESLIDNSDDSISIGSMVTVLRESTHPSSR